MHSFPDPLLTSPEVTRLRIAYMTVAMKDPNLVHMEDDYAKLSGLPQVIAHGTFAVSYVGAAVSRAVGIENVTRLRVELTAPVFPHDVITVKFTDAEDQAGISSGKLVAHNQSGDLVARGLATWLTGPSR